MILRFISYMNYNSCCTKYTNGWTSATR